jgi:hypothetical protein
MKQEWISVADRLPNDFNDVIVCDIDNVVCPAFIGEDGQWWDDHRDKNPLRNITFWMPLPSPPQQ